MSSIRKSSRSRTLSVKAQEINTVPVTRPSTPMTLNIEDDDSIHKRRKLDSPSTSSDEEEEMVFESEVESDLESELSDYDEADFTKPIVKLDREDTKIDPVERLLSYANRNASDNFLDDEETVNERSFESNQNFQKLVDEELKLKSLNINSINLRRAYFESVAFSNLNSITPILNQFQPIHPPLMTSQFPQATFEASVQPSQSSSSMEDFLSYEEQADDEEKDASTDSNVPYSDNFNFEYRLNDNLNLALPQISSSPNARRYLDSGSVWDDATNNVFRILNKRSILTGKAAEMVGTGVVINDFLL